MAVIETCIEYTYGSPNPEIDLLDERLKKIVTVEGRVISTSEIVVDFRAGRNFTVIGLSYLVAGTHHSTRLKDPLHMIGGDSCQFTLLVQDENGPCAHKVGRTGWPVPTLLYPSVDDD